MIDARSLHEWLGCKRMFAHWIKERVADYGFEANTDFWPISAKTRGRARKDYLLTIDMAKELSMIERTDKGRRARRYFIQMEKAAVQMASDHVANGTPEAIPQTRQSCILAATSAQQGEVAVKSILAAIALLGAAAIGASAPLCTTAYAQACCKTCKAGKACGNSCIARDKACTQPKGCACNG